MSSSIISSISIPLLTIGALLALSLSIILDDSTQQLQSQVVELQRQIRIASAISNNSDEHRSFIITTEGMTNTEGRQLCSCNSTSSFTYASDFGVIGDSDGDDTAALQAAIDNASANDSGGIVVIPKGTFRIFQPLVIRAGVTLQGQGYGDSPLAISFNAGGSVIAYCGTDYAVKLEGHAAGLRDLAVYDWPYGTNCENIKAAGGVLVEADNTTLESVIVSNVFIYYFVGGNALSLVAKNSAGVGYGNYQNVRIRHAKIGISMQAEEGSFVNSNSFLGGGISGGDFDYGLVAEGPGACNDNKFYGIFIEPPDLVHTHVYISGSKTSIRLHDVRLEAINKTLDRPIVIVDDSSYGNVMNGFLGHTHVQANLNRNPEIDLMNQKSVGLDVAPINLFWNSAFLGYNANDRMMPGFTLDGTNAEISIVEDENEMLFPDHNVINVNYLNSGGAFKLMGDLMPTAPGHDFATFGIFARSSVAGSISSVMRYTSGSIISSASHSGGGDWEYIGMTALYDKDSPYFYFSVTGDVEITAPTFVYGQSPSIPGTSLMSSSGATMSGTLTMGVTTVYPPPDPTPDYWVIPKNSGNIFLIDTQGDPSRTIIRLNHESADRFARGTLATLMFEVAGTRVKHNAYIKLKNNVDFVSDPNTSITLMASGSASWIEVSRNDDLPTNSPSSQPSDSPSSIPSQELSGRPSSPPSSLPSLEPSSMPSSSSAPSLKPSISAKPTSQSCTAATSCADLQTLLEDSAADGSTAKICASETPIDCRATKQSAAKIVLNADTLGGTGKLTKAKCISNDLTVTRCVVDMSPNYNNDDPSGPYYGETLAYLGILMRDASSLYLEGFEFTGVQGNSNVNYVQDGSNFVCRGCVFRNIVARDTVRGAVARDLTRSSSCGSTAFLGNIVFDQCMFEDNVGELIYVQDSVLTVTNSIFQNNIQEGSRKGGFITYTGDAVNSFDHTLANNTFIKNDASSSDNIWLNRGIPAVCKEDAPTGWQSRDDCQSLLTKYTGNCQFENKDNFSCNNGLFITWPMDQCVEFATCTETSRSLYDIYPVINFPDVSMYITSGPCLSASPSSEPSLIPSVSFSPSSEPSIQPSSSTNPTNSPSCVPSKSLSPSESPSLAPSISTIPSKSLQPSTSPSDKPSKSFSPSLSPSSLPSISVEPSISVRPSPAKGEPSFVVSSPPSSSSDISSSAPSFFPTISQMPSEVPTFKVSAYYYPKWDFNEQYCTNDGETPEYMETILRGNYLYQDKQDCCETHFSWRVRQCMGNDEPVYYRDGSSSTCKKGETRDDYDIAYDTLEECCENLVWWDEYGCLQNSPLVLEFEYRLNFINFIEPTNCQTADDIAKRIQEAMTAGLPPGTTILVVGIGAATIENDVDLGTTQCGGSLAGQGYQGDWDISSTVYLDALGVTAPITFRVSKNCGSDCTDKQSVQSLYDSTFESLEDYAEGSMTQDVIQAGGRNPAILQLQSEELLVESGSMVAVGTYKDPRAEMEELVVEATLLTLAGVFTITGFDTSSLSHSDMTLAMSYFQAAIQTTLFSEGISCHVQVTDIVVESIIYIVNIAADSSSEADADASRIESTLATEATRLAIATEAVRLANNSGTRRFLANSNSSTLLSAFNSGFLIVSNTVTSKSKVSVAKIAVEGQFLTSDVGFDSADEQYLEDAIYDVLFRQGVISDVAEVKVTGSISGMITYAVISYVDVAGDVKADADKITSKLTEVSTYTEIASVAVSFPGSTLSGSVPPFQIFTSTHLTTTGVPSRGWWPYWGGDNSECKNGGAAPAYMNRQYDQFFSKSKRECCQEWFSYNFKDCVGPTIGGSTKEYFLPNWADGNCHKKQEGIMEVWELMDKFDSLVDCCKMRFSFSIVECCNAPGLGGCSLSTEILYHPVNGKCVGESESSLQEYEKTFAHSTMKDCCTSNFWWRERLCCRESGGC